MIVVEVKLADNPELTDRRVIAQIVEYAGALVALDDRSLLSMFPGGSAAKNWTDFVKTCFPNEYRIDELAQVLRDRILTGQINIVIACDGVPSGLRQLIAGIAAQNAIGFELDVVEITPYVCPSNSKQVIAFIPTVRVSTEIVARTAVSITYRQADSQPSTSITVTTPDPAQIAANVQDVSGESRNWTETEVIEAIRKDGNPTVKQLFDYAKQHSDDNNAMTTGVKKSPSFGLHIWTFSPTGERKRMCLFSYPFLWRTVYIYLKQIGDTYGSAIQAQFSQQLTKTFGNHLIGTEKQPAIRLDELATTFEALARIFDWLLTQPKVGNNQSMFE
jgi:hypothetical protein